MFEIFTAEYFKVRQKELGTINGLKTLLYLSMWGKEISEIIPGTFEKIRRL
jgi:hypothetical protein